MKNNNDPEKIMQECLQILIKKHKDYGPLNIAHAPGGAMNGLTVRMYDKLARISHLCSDKNDTPNYESIEDSLIDLVNYATIGILVQRGLWEGIPLRSTYEEDSSSI
jgi:hypothetical protein